MQNTFWQCLHLFINGLSQHWIAIVGGAVVGALVLALGLFGLKIEKRWVAAIFLIGLLVASFRAWRDQYASAEWRGKDRQRVIGQNEILESSNQAYIAEGSRLKNLPIQSPRQQAKWRAIQLADSLRKLAWKGNEEWRLQQGNSVTRANEVIDTYAQQYRSLYRKDVSDAHEQLLGYLDVGLRDPEAEGLYKNAFAPDQYEQIADDLDRLAEKIPPD